MKLLKCYGPTIIFDKTNYITNHYFTKFRQWSKIVAIHRMVLKFIGRSQRKQQVATFEDVENNILQIIQQQHCGSDVDRLQSGKSLSIPSPYHRQSVELENGNIIILMKRTQPESPYR
ncbi:hypothetical protein SNEBB_006529, partial [Seison nebaliae]